MGKIKFRLQRSTVYRFLGQFSISQFLFRNKDTEKMRANLDRNITQRNVACRLIYNLFLFRIIIYSYYKNKKYREGNPEQKEYRINKNRVEDYTDIIQL